MTTTAGDSSDQIDRLLNHVTIQSIRFNDGTVIDLEPDGLLLIVGPNNSGKSQALRDIDHALAGESLGKVVNFAQIVKNGDVEEVLAHLERSGRVQDGQVNLNGSDYSVSALASWWSVPGSLSGTAPLFVLHATTENRLKGSLPVRTLDLYQSRPIEPIHFLYAFPELESELNQFCRAAFGFGVMLDRYAGGNAWALRIGDAPVSTSARPSAEFLSAVQAMPLLNSQGDGVRSLVGLWLAWVVGAHEIALIDEPEAFLHPPQAAFLARKLSDDAQSSGRQVIMGTHSSDVVRGAMLGSGAVTVVRITRQGNINVASVVPNEVVNVLWDDPLLRYSNLLEGLFSDGVAVCESDMDCLYYAAVLDAWAVDESESPADTRRPDVLFAHCGGKHRLHVAVRAMVAAGVPVVAIADFDVLREKETLVRIVEAFGRVFDESMETDWRVLSGALQTEARAPNLQHTRDAIDEYLTAQDPGPLTQEHSRTIKRMVRTETGWDRVNAAGQRAVPPGDAYRACERLLRSLGRVGLHIVPVGEIESFAPQVGLHGPSWAARVLEMGLHQRPDSREAHDFLQVALSRIAEQ